MGPYTNFHQELIEARTPGFALRAVKENALSKPNYPEIHMQVDKISLVAFMILLEYLKFPSKIS